jgi:hypothetical protein
MSNDTSTEISWGVLDQDTVMALVDSKGTDALAQSIEALSPSPSERADALVDLAINGRIPKLKIEAKQLAEWASDYGVLRIENALIELERVLSSDKRGEAIMQAQALTRFIARYIDSDVNALKASISSQG